MASMKGFIPGEGGHINEIPPDALEGAVRGEHTEESSGLSMDELREMFGVNEGVVLQQEYLDKFDDPEIKERILEQLMNGKTEEDTWGNTFIRFSSLGQARLLSRSSMLQSLKL